MFISGIIFTTIYYLNNLQQKIQKEILKNTCYIKIKIN